MQLLSGTDNGNKTPLELEEAILACTWVKRPKDLKFDGESRFPPLLELIKRSRDYDLESKIDGPIVLACCTTNMFDHLLKSAKQNQRTTMRH
ncbi:hypothetical protein P3X46_010371 [Hevea brasiliensis]|uniref:Uncharacterized protein n=1 Tax=Hevea brasiliensis TaxID=3981 RepID=A0ABQ9MI07_HEVBR|nr:hypothetical protein P3X46_010371 [Hevea brasiliensis]